LIQIDTVSARIKELETAVADGIVRLEVGKRSAWVAMLQDRVDRLLALSATRAVRCGSL
jgi:hypothetical protein